jgi:2-C-methyl-D-erythritol 2,4-cyclodiphosphate synthase
MLGGRGFRVVNADVTVVTERPRLSPWKDRIRKSLAELLGIDPMRVNVKAKTREGLGVVGEGRAMEAHAVVLVTGRGQ